MPSRLVVPILLLLVTGSATGATVPESNGATAPRDEQTEEPIDLSRVHSIAVVENQPRPSESYENLRETLTRWLPGVVQVSSNGADLLVDYSSSPYPRTVEPSGSDLSLYHVVLDADRGPEFDASLLWSEDELPMPPVPWTSDAAAAPRPDVPSLERRVSWSARLYRFDCQSAVFGEKPTPAVDGYCENRVYVRVELGTMEGTEDDEASAMRAFAAQLRQALLMPVPAAEGD